jgi:hypothetical protein
MPNSPEERRSSPKPRPTAWWSRQGAAVKAALLLLRENEEYLTVYQGAVGFSVGSALAHGEALRQARTLEADGTLGEAGLLRAWIAERDVATRRAAQEVFLPLVVAAALAASPRLGAVFGEHRLRDFLSGLIAAGAVCIIHGEEAALEMLVRTAPTSFLRLVGNPLMLLTCDGSLVAGASEDPRHYQDVVAYKRSLRPEGKTGRPPGVPRPPSSGRKRIDLDKARAIRQMRQGGASLKEIALKFFPDIPPDSSSARGRISRHLEAADLADLRD